MKFDVTISEVNAHIQTIEQQKEEFTTCMNRLQTASTNLERAALDGDFRHHFDEGTTARMNWLNQMVQNVDEYIKAVKAAMQAYQDADIEAAQIIKGK